MKPYPAYKDSGVSWLGKIPSHWEMHRLDRLFTLRNEPPQDDDERVTGYLDGRVTLRSNVAGQKIKGVIKEAGWQRIYPGDFAISGMNAHLGGMGVSDSAGKCSPIYLVLKPQQNTNAQYVAHVVRYIAHTGILKTLVNTIRFNSADFKRDDLKQIRVWLPSQEEQQQIVRFIGLLNVRVNRLIRAKRRLIELLNEQKQAFILRAVTQGLDPNVPKKPSGIDWLSDIPSHWNAVPLKRVFTEIDHRTQTGNEMLLSLRINQGLIPDPKQINGIITANNIIGYKHIKPGQIVMNRMQAANGLFAIAQLEGVLSPDYAVFYTSAACPRYFIYLFKTSIMKVKFRHESKGLGTGMSGFLRLYTDRFGIIKVPVPPTDEQVKIMKAIEDNSVSKAIQKAEREIELVREYRTRLIADVVTGKLDVRGATFPVSEPVDEWDSIVEETDEDVEESEGEAGDDADDETE